MLAVEYSKDSAGFVVATKESSSVRGVFLTVPYYKHTIRRPGILLEFFGIGLFWGLAEPASCHL